MEVSVEKVGMGGQGAGWGFHSPSWVGGGDKYSRSKGEDGEGSLLADVENNRAQQWG